MTPIQVVIVDNEVGLTRAVAGRLAMEEDIEVVGQCQDGFEAIELAGRLLPDVLLLDLLMEGMGGLEALPRIRQESPSTAVLIWTIRDDNVNLFPALLKGAKGYLLKSSTFEEIVAAVRDVARAGVAIPPMLAARVIDEYRRVSALANDNLFSLTHREAEILSVMTSGKTNSQIGAELGIKRSTVTKHVTHILEKLEVNNRIEAALIAQSSGGGS